MTAYDDDDPAWPPRCRGLLEGMRLQKMADDVEIKHLTAQLTATAEALRHVRAALEALRYKTRET